MTAGKRERLCWPIIRTELPWRPATCWPSLIFVSADEGLLAAAVAEGLKVENPNRH